MLLPRDLFLDLQRFPRLHIGESVHHRPVYGVGSFPKLSHQSNYVFTAQPRYTLRIFETPARAAL